MQFSDCVRSDVAKTRDASRVERRKDRSDGARTRDALQWHCRCVPRGPRRQGAGGRGREEHRRRACKEVIRRLVATGLHGHGEAQGKEPREGAEADIKGAHGAAK